MQHIYKINLSDNYLFSGRKLEEYEEDDYKLGLLYIDDNKVQLIKYHQEEINIRYVIVNKDYMFLKLYTPILRKIY